MCTYLDKVGSTYYFRRPVPSDLRGHFLTASGKPRVDWKISLGTKDRDEAKRRLHLRVLEHDRIVDDARAKLARLEAEAAAPAGEVPDYTPRRAAHRAQRHEEAQFHYQMEVAAWAEREQSEKDVRREELSAAIDALKDHLKGKTAEMPPEIRTIAYLVEGLNFDSALLKDRIAFMEAERSALNAPSPAADDKPKAVEAPASSVPLLKTFDAYAAEQKIKPAGRIEWRAILEKLIAFLGHDDASRITIDDLDRWRDSLLSETTSRGGLRTPRTVKDKYISTIRATLNYAIEKRWLKENVASNVVVRVPKVAKLRDRGFSTEEARAILSAALEPMPKVSAEQQFARRWIPWLCAYTGARVNELSQMRRQDVKQADGVWCITITPEAGTVKANEARTVPLHPHLIEQGFPQAAMAKPDGALFYDPSKRRTAVEKEGNRHFKKVGENLALWVRKDIGVSDPNVQPNHGWRHAFKTRAFEAGVPERVADAIQGHAAKTVGQTYGSVSVKTMSDNIGKMPRFDLAKPD